MGGEEQALEGGVCVGGTWWLNAELTFALDQSLVYNLHLPGACARATAPSF